VEQRVRTGSLPFPAPNEALEATGHSAGPFTQFVGQWGCGPRLSLGVGQTKALVSNQSAFEMRRAGRLWEFTCRESKARGAIWR
jgi:hypothetical protein